jgi:hypothetical protein
VNTFVKYSILEKCMPVLIASFATVSIVFGMCWSLHASLLLQG